MHVDTLVAAWPEHRPPRPAAERDAFAAEVARRYGLELPADYRRFLELTDGGQLDHALLDGACLPDDGADDGSGPVLRIGGSGNLDAYVLRPGGTAAIVNLFDLTEVTEAFPSFTALLARLVSGSASPA